MHSSSTGTLISVVTVNGADKSVSFFCCPLVHVKVPSVNVLWNCLLMNCSVGQDLTEDISQDALELYVESITGAGVENIRYMNRKTEAMVKLDKSIPFDSEKTGTVSKRIIKIIPMRTRGKPFSPTGWATQHQPEKKAEQKPSHSRFRAEATPPVVRAEDEQTASKVRAEEKPMVSEDRGVYVDDISVGCEDDAKETTECVVGSRAQSQPGSSPKESHIQETVTVAAGKRDLLKMLLPDLQASLPDCSLKFSMEGIELKGPAKAVTQAKFDISELVFRFKSHTIEGNSQRVRLLQSDKSQQQVQELFSKAGIQAVLSVRGDQLLLTAADDEQKSQASRILERNIHRSEIPVDDFHQEFLQSAQWKQFIDDLERNYTITVEKGTSSVVIEALGDCSEDLLKQVRDKLEDNAQQSDDIQLTEEEWHLLKTYHQTDIEDLCKKTG